MRKNIVFHFNGVIFFFYNNVSGRTQCPQNKRKKSPVVSYTITCIIAMKINRQSSKQCTDLFDNFI